jgi:hypothetical protein
LPASTNSPNWTNSFSDVENALKGQHRREHSTKMRVGPVEGASLLLSSDASDVDDLFADFLKI